METAVVSIPAACITDWGSFHVVFSQAMGFPDFYGRNMDAWIDCMTYLDDEPSGMTMVWPRMGEVLTLRIEDASAFRQRCPDQYDALVECVAFVNARRAEKGEQPILALDLED